MARERSLARCKKLQGDIRSALATGPIYPWVLLARLNPDKFFSDVIESVIGAIFIDSRGDLSPCQRFIERIGITQYLRRVLAERVVVEHPRNALQRITGSEAVQYIIDCEGESSIQSYRCTVSMNEEILAQVDGCLSKDEAVTVAAETAKTLLLERRKEHGKATA